jgi:DNA-binding response OmpR family regulator
MNSISKPLILIIENDTETAALISTYLEKSNMYPQICYNAEKASNFLKNNFVNLILLDVQLPDSSGFEFLKKIRINNFKTPVIFLTGETSEVKKIKGLEMGGDDYITKPFSFPELIARINTVLRRTEIIDDTKLSENTTVNDKPFIFCNAEITPENLKIKFKNNKIEILRPKDLGIISYIKSKPNQIRTRKELIHSIWGIHANINSRSLDQYIVKIRNIYNKNSKTDIDKFKTIHKIGYIYELKEK